MDPSRFEGSNRFQSFHEDSDSRQITAMHPSSRFFRPQMRQKPGIVAPAADEPFDLETSTFTPYIGARM